MPRKLREFDEEQPFIGMSKDFESASADKVIIVEKKDPMGDCLRLVCCLWLLSAIGRGGRRQYKLIKILINVSLYH